MTTAEVAAVIGAIGGAVGGLAAVGAWIVAIRANGRAAEALRLQRAALPPVWGPREELGENVIGFRNQSSRSVVVTKVIVEPEEAAPFVKDVPRGTRVEYGDVLVVRLDPRLSSPAPRRLEIYWHYDDDQQRIILRHTRQM